MKNFTLLSFVAALSLTSGIATAAEVGYTASPANNSVLNEITSVTLSFEEGVAVGFYDVRPAVAQLENLTTGDLWFCVTPTINRPDENGVRSLTFEFSDLGSESPVSITEIGEYTLSIKGLYTSTINEEGEESEPDELPVITLNYTVEYPLEFTLDPANGSEVNDLNTISLTFPAGSNVGYYDVHPAVGTLTNVTTDEVWYCLTPQMSFTDEGAKVFTFEFSELGESTPANINSVGDYTFTVRGLYTSSIDEDGEESEPVDLPVINATYTINYPVEYTLDPADGSVVKSISAVTISFAAGSNVGFIGDTYPAVAILENTETEDVWYCVDPADNGFDDDGNRMFVLDFSEFGSDETVDITLPGVYKLSIRGLYTSTLKDDEESDEVLLPIITATYTISYPVEYSFTPASGSEVENISSIVLTFEGNPNIGIYEEMRPAAVVLENLTTGNVWYCESPIKARLEDGSSEFTMTFNELGDSESVVIDEEGEYLLTVKGIYESVLNEDETQTDTELPDLTANYVVTENAGIHNIFNSDSYNVVGINGVSVLRNGSSQDLLNLAPGLYIINGKKVLVRK